MKSRTENVARNLKSSVLFQITNILIKFLLRTVFIYTLGKEYLGVNGVFTNILTVLSLSELGLGTAIVYDMYRPIAEKDTEKEIQLFKFYRYIYAAVGSVILILGFLLVPFLKYIIKDVPNVSHLYLIYCLQLISTSASYFFAQYRSLLDAHQLNSINTNNNWIFAIIKTAAQIGILIFLKSYILFLLTDLAVTVLSNYMIALKCRKMFPYIASTVKKAVLVDKGHIFKNAMSMFSIKVGITVVNATDNLLVSAFISTILVGMYSNYSMITSVITASTMMISSSLQASVGNLCVAKNYKKTAGVFEKIRFLYVSLYAIICVCMISLINPFIELWAGTEYVLDSRIVFVIVLNLYLTGVHQPIEVFLYADGLFRYFKIKPWIEAAINLLVSIALAKPLGIIGIFIGTTVSHVTTTLWYDARIVYKYSLHEKLKNYWVQYFKYAVPTFTMGVLLAFGAERINPFANPYLSFVVKLILVFVLSASGWVLLFGRTEQFKYYLTAALSKLQRKIKTI